MDDHPQNVSRPRMCEFPAGQGKGTGLAWPEGDPTQEEPHLEEVMILTEKGMRMVIQRGQCSGNAGAMQDRAQSI